MNSSFSISDSTEESLESYYHNTELPSNALNDKSCDVSSKVTNITDPEVLLCDNIDDLLLGEFKVNSCSKDDLNIREDMFVTDKLDKINMEDDVYHGKISSNPSKLFEGKTSNVNAEFDKHSAELSFNITKRPNCESSLVKPICDKRPRILSVNVTKVAKDCLLTNKIMGPIIKKKITGKTHGTFKNDNKLKINLKLITTESDKAADKVNEKRTRYIIVKPGKPKLAANILGSSSEALDSPIKKDLGFPCLTCGVIATKEITAKCHKLAHVTGFKCPFCPQAFFKKHTVDIHKQLHRGGEVKHVDDFGQCKICGGSFISLMYLEFHIYESHGADILEDPKVIHLGTSHIEDVGESKSLEMENKKKFRCGTCNALFAHSLNLDCHMEFHKITIYACGMCNSSFSLLDDLVSHSHIHTNKTFNNIFESIVSEFEKSGSATNSILDQNSFEQVLEIQDHENSRNFDFDEFCFEDMINDVQPEKSHDISTKMTKTNKPVVKILNNSNRRTPVIHNKKFVNSRGSSCRQLRLSNPNYTTFTKDFSDSLDCKQNNDAYINPYLYHFLPNGKYAKYFKH